MLSIHICRVTCIVLSKNDSIIISISSLNILKRPSHGMQLHRKGWWTVNCLASEQHPTRICSLEQHVHARMVCFDAKVLTGHCRSLYGVSVLFCTPYRLWPPLLQSDQPPLRLPRCQKYHQVDLAPSVFLPKKRKKGLGMTKWGLDFLIAKANIQEVPGWHT